MDAEKVIKTYGKNYRTVLKEGRFADIEQKMKAFESRLREMYASEIFRKHNIYPTTDATYIYAVMAMCLEIRSFGYSDKDTIRIVNKGFEKRRNFFKRIIAVINLLPNSFDIARKWNISDHEKRVKDGSIIVPAMCAIDYLFGECSNHWFLRESTIATGGAVCDCGYVSKRAATPEEIRRSKENKKAEAIRGRRKEF